MIQSGEGVCRSLANCVRDWPSGDKYKRFLCTGPEDVICCKPVCQINTGNWTTCNSCPGTPNIETRNVTIVDDQGFGVNTCLRSVQRERPCSMPCPSPVSTAPGATTTATTTTTSTTTTTTTSTASTTTERLSLPSGVTAEPDTTTESTAPYTGTVPVIEVTATPLAQTTTQATTGSEQQSGMGMSNPTGDIGVEPWIIGVAVGGGLLLLICLVLCLVCVVRRRRSAYHSDRDESIDEPPAAAQLRPTSTYASPTPLTVVEYDMVPPETADIDAAIERTKNSHSYTMLSPEKATAETPISYDQSIPTDDRFSMAPKY